MATGLGLEPDQAGNGTTPDDLQRIIGASYRVEGIMSGCAVAQMSKMSYKVFAGAVVMNWGTDQKIAVPVPATEVPTDPNPGTKTRRDKVYVQQRTVSADGDNLVVVKVTQGALPPRSVLLADYEVPAGATSTTGAVDRANRVYTRPVGGQFGQIAKFVDKDSSEHTTGVFKRGQQQLFFGATWAGVAPTDRDVIVFFNSCVSASDNPRTQMTLDESGSVIYKFYLNGTLVYSFERPYDKYWSVYSVSFPLVLQQFVNDMYYTVERRYVPSGSSGKWKVRYGGKDQFPGDQMWVVDNGVANL